MLKLLSECWPLAKNAGGYFYPNIRYGQLHRVVRLEVVDWIIKTLPAVYEKASTMYEEKYGTREQRHKAVMEDIRVGRPI